MSSRMQKIFIFSAVVVSFGLLTRLSTAQDGEGRFRVKKIESLKSIPVPGPSDAELAQYISNKKVAIELGKALFWDQKVGSDNKTACASCHFHAGADNRVKNQLNPGQIAKDNLFSIPGSGPNFLLDHNTFPFTSNDIASSQGVFNREFIAAGVDGEEDECKTVIDDVFHVRMPKGHRVNTRKNEQRNTPSVINAVFNFRNFWDGRATNTFNGIDPFGLRNEASYVWKVVNNKMQKVKMTLPSSSLASQASGPPLSGFEMSCRQRLFHHIGRKLINRPILDQQTIASSDSVLGHHSYHRPKYIELIKKAFRHEYWSGENVPYAGAAVGSMDLVDPPLFMDDMEGESIKQVEANFAFFFGLAIQLYESTLVSDDAPFDRFAAGQTDALTDQQKRGLALFNGRAACVFCHSGPELTSASFSSVTDSRITRVRGRGTIFHDTGFFNIGVRPTDEDLAVGGDDPFGRPLSETEMIRGNLTHLLGNDFDPTKNPKPEDLVQVANAGAFKAPGLRNVELTGPYFHNGGKSTLRQVIEFYNIGGDFKNPEITIRPLNLSETQVDDLVAFLLSLTDERVRFKRAPFDHPSLCFPAGHKGDSHRVVDRGDGNAVDIMECLPAVGAKGVSHRHRLKPFLE